MLSAQGLANAVLALGMEMPHVGLQPPHHDPKAAGLCNLVPILLQNGGTGGEASHTRHSPGTSLFQPQGLWDRVRAWGLHVLCCRMDGFRTVPALRGQRLVGLQGCAGSGSGAAPSCWAEG